VLALLRRALSLLASALYTTGRIYIGLTRNRLTFAGFEAGVHPPHRFGNRCKVFHAAESLRRFHDVVAERAVIGIMGWSDPGMTKRYQHLTTQVTRNVAIRVSNALWGGPTPSL
jgi:hypothetical protein